MNQSSSTPHVVTDYLQRLEAATADLPPDVRDDLIADVRSHLDEAVERASSEAQLRDAVDRLGPPEAIAAEARAGRPPAPPMPAAPTTPRTSRRGFDVTALLFLVLGGAVFSFVLGWLGLLLGWAVGLGMLWASRSWSFGEKLLGSLVWPGGLAAPLLLASLSTQVCTSVASGSSTTETVVEPTTCTGFALPVWLGVPTMLALVAAPLVVAAVLLRRADGRR